MRYVFGFLIVITIVLKSVMIIMVLVPLLTSYTAASMSVFAVEETSNNDKGKTETTTKSETKSETPNKDNNNPSNVDTGKPDISPTPGETNDKNTVNQPVEPTKPTEPVKPAEPKQLPKCDGTFKDCTTRNGDTCKAGEGGDKCECLPDMSDCKNHPSLQTPDKNCAFHPDSPKCAPDKDGNCPPGFSHNVHGNCFPSGKCPSGFSRHTDDETGKCFSNRNPHHTIIVVKHSGSSSSSSSSSHSLSSTCFNEIKIAWLGKIQRGDNSKVDNVIDKCLNIK